MVRKGGERKERMNILEELKTLKENEMNYALALVKINAGVVIGNLTSDDKKAFSEYCMQAFCITHRKRVSLAAKLREDCR